jgi:TRAP-type C4-dicarboxylate transport system substrate-binding protein
MEEFQMKKKVLLITCVILALVLSLVGACAKPAEEVTWQFTTCYHAPEDSQMAAYWMLKDAVLARTNGKFTINMACDGELGIKRDEFAGASKQGVTQGSEMSASFAATTWPFQGALALPYIVSSSEEAAKMQAALAPMREKAYAKEGLMRLSSYIWVSQELFCREKIEDISNLRGLKIRGWSDIMLDWVKAAGGVPVSMASSEVYMAIQRGVCDGGITGSASALTSSWYEVAPYAHLIHFMYVISDVVINKAAFDALPKEYQDILLDEGRNMTENFKAEYAKEEATAWDEWRAGGGEVVELTPEQYSKLKQMGIALWDQWVEKTGPEGKEAVDIIRKALGI